MVEVARSTTHTENQRTPESPITYTPLLGLQGRLAMGGAALFPSTEVELTKGVDEENTRTTIALLDKASTRERKAHWAAQPEQSKDVQLSQWKKTVVAKINLIPTSTLGQNHADFFERLGIDPVHFNEDNAQHLYDKYFSKNISGVGIEVFATDIVKAYIPDGSNDTARLKSHLAAAKWMAGMFGGNSAELITQLIDTEIDNLSPDTFVAARKDKVNNLSEHEKDLLTFLTEGETVPTKPPEIHVENPEDEAPNQPNISLLDLQELKNNNLIASSHFIEVIRDGLHQGGNPNYLENKFGMPIEKNSEYFDASMFTVKMGDLYDLPLGMMVRGAHAFLITNGPHERAGKWYLSVWNPFGQGGTGKAETEEVELHGDYSTPNLFTTNIQNEVNVSAGAPNFIVNEQWFGEYKKDPQFVNLEALLDQPEFAGIRDELRELKFSALQKDNKNCVPLCGYLDAMLHRLSDTSPFVTSGGIKKFEKDFGIHIKSKVELNPIPAGRGKPEEDFFCLLANKKTIQEVDMNALIREYHDNPVAQIKKMQELTTTTVLRMKKEGKTESEIKEYINAFLDTQIFLDHSAFPPDDVVQKGVPAYIPDGLSDMGSDSEIDDTKRTREKIRVDKKKTFENSIEAFYSIFTTETPPTLSQKDKEIELTNALSRYIHNKIKYDYQDQLGRIYGVQGQSINMGDIENLKLGVCRHHAIDTQILLQSLGIDSRLMKSNFQNPRVNGAHANNLVHIDGTWYLLDTTNPEYRDDSTHTPIVYLKPLSESSIDLNTQQYTWELDNTEKDGSKEKRRYVSRNNMFYRIRNNAHDPAPSHYKK